ncbi:hypothetical protein ACFL35_20015 [Candidatus Riflebacteria bacterium]
MTAYHSVTEWAAHARRGTKESRLNSSSWFGQGRQLKRAFGVALEHVV